MSTSTGSGGDSNGGGVQPVPAMVQSLKEIVNCSEAEIYATLRDCNMDPNETVNRLLSQDPFHEVKSKREKKKEGKDTTESRPRGPNHNSSRGSKTSNSRGVTPTYYSSESAPVPGKSSFKKENGLNPYSDSLSSMHGVSGNDRSRAPAGFSDGASAENKGSSFWTADALPHGIQQAPGYQSAWSGPPGQVSMADIVKMGRSQNKAPNATNLPEDHHESGISSFQQFPTNEEWTSMNSVENPDVTNVISGPEYNVDSEQYIEAHDVPADYINRPHETEETEEAEGDDIENSGGYNLGSNSFSSRKIPEDDSRSASLFAKDLYNNLGSYQHRAHNFHEDEENAPLSSVTRNLQQLNVEKDYSGLPSDGYAPSVPSVVIPDHLQVQNVDCSHLSFGSFGPKKPLPVKSNLENPHNEADVSSSVHLNNRTSQYYVDDSLGNASNVGLFHRSNPSAGSYDPSPVSQLEELKQPENAELVNQYSYHISNRGYTFDDAKHLNFPFSQSSSQMQNLASFPKDMPYTNSLSSNFSPGNVHNPGRESDIQLSQFPTTQSMPSKYGNLVSTIGGSSIPVSEALKTGGFSSTQSALQTLSGTGVATGPSLPQHLAVNQFSQPTHPLGPYANMIGYPLMPQSYTYVPSAFQQTFAGNNTYHQSLAALLPQFKNTVSSGSMAQSAAGGGAFGNTTAVPGNFQMNHSPATAAAAPLSVTQTLSYDDVLRSQYKDNTSHLVSLQRQNENSGMWPHGLNPRTMSAAPASNYYNYQQGQNQQTAEGFRQGQQQPSQNYGTHGYPNFYHTQGGGISLNQHQNLREGSLGASQGQPKQPQIWHNGY